MSINSLSTQPLQQQSQLRPKHIALSIGEQHISYQQLYAMVSATAEQLRMQGVGKGSRVCCFGEDPLRMLLLQLASLQLAYVFCPLNHHHPLSQLQALSETVDSQFYWSDLDLCLTTPKRVEFNPHQALSFNAEAELDSELPQSMVFTSGSSGPPKAVVHCWRNHFFSAQGSQAVVPLDENDQWLLSLPLYHIGGQAIVWRCILAGARIVVAQNKGRVFPDLLASQTTHVSLVPTQLYRLLTQAKFWASALSLKHILIGGAACNDSLLEEAISRGFQVYSSYGSSEMSSQIATRHHRLGQATYQLLPHRRAKIHQGEIYLRGKTLFLGYWKNGDIIRACDPDGWFNSGDLGRIEGAQLFTLGRSNNMFICAGENIQPEEIELALLQHPQINQAIVVPQQNSEYGQRPVAFISSELDVNPQQLNQFLRQQLAAIKLPIAYFDLPEQNSLKPSRSELSTLANHKSSCCDQC
ncbi:o-succinylbenzoate--CoA ligase [Agarivorans sp. 1_MG-2023]|uniref:o-succinylbenzoate--CoA ligase n=1 Tax=Agarivorans sp. 1_MG-2023 TaxID=3062634 RepID=UPI0026E37FC4|nr:o-succinylbenzoate--CoA ligase [Agarivorans sp. 1_MG-2023]MDO6763193.1 o-succinylbenzoate--CoA ligase [Agarivorans sp. 1_MG-2023]